MNPYDSEWQCKGATLSDKTARKEFGLTQEEIVQAIRAGRLQYRHGAMHGNPFLRLLRREVETLVMKRHGDDYGPRRQPRDVRSPAMATLKTNPKLSRQLTATRQ